MDEIMNERKMAWWVCLAGMQSSDSPAYRGERKHSERDYSTEKFLP